jgi:HlyD family secretion protein
VKGAALFALEVTSELAAQKESSERLRQAEAKLADLKKGQRPTEIAALEAKLAQAKNSMALAVRQVERVTKLFSSKSISEDDVDKATSTRDSTAKQIAEVEAQIATAKLGGRADAIAAAEADVAAAKAALERADWSVNQKTQAAPADALVYDTLYREGEFAPAGSPVVALLPPDHLKVRFFLPEAELAALKTGDVVKVTMTGRETPIEARVSYLSPKPEYTPPVLYNRENRSKLVFMIEAVPVDATVARDLHPGQPVDVTR